MAVASWNEWQQNLSWNGNTGGRDNPDLYANYVNEYKKYEDAGNIAGMRVLNDAHGFLPGVATDNAPVAHHAPAGHHGGGGGGGSATTSALEMLLMQMIAQMTATPEEPEAPAEGQGLSETMLSSTGRPQRKRTYLTPALETQTV